MPNEQNIGANVAQQSDGGNDGGDASVPGGDTGIQADPGKQQGQPEPAGDTVTREPTFAETVAEFGEVELGERLRGSPEFAYALSVYEEQRTEPQIAEHYTYRDEEYENHGYF